MATNDALSAEKSADVLRTLRENRDELLAREGYSEDDTIRLLITPFLDYLGHRASHRRSEHEVNRNRPDEVIYDRPASRAGDLPCRIILEAKPLGTIFAVAMALDHFGESDAADRANAAALRVLNDGEILTADLGGGASTREVGDAVMRL